MSSKYIPGFITRINISRVQVGCSQFQDFQSRVSVPMHVHTTKIKVVKLKIEPAFWRHLGFIHYYSD